MFFDVWFAKDETDQLWFNVAPPGEPPYTTPTRAKSVAHALAFVKKSGCKVAQVGIADMEMIRV